MGIQATRRKPRRRLGKIDDFIPQSMAGKTMSTIFETFPRNQEVESIQIDKHRHITEFGMDADAVWYVVSGRIVTVYNDPDYGPYEFDEFNPGSFLGELEVMMLKDHYIANARTMIRSTLLRIDRCVYEKWMDNNPGVYKVRVAALINRIMTQIDESRSAMFENKDVRLIRFLIARYHEAIPEGQIRTIRYTREEIGNRLGCSARTVNRTLNELEALGLISRKRGKVVLNPDQIQALEQKLKNQ